MTSVAADSMASRSSACAVFSKARTSVSSSVCRSTSGGSSGARSRRGRGAGGLSDSALALPISEATRTRNCV